MFKTLETPATRLVCFGSSRALTASDGEKGPPEPVFPLEYNI